MTNSLLNQQLLKQQLLKQQLPKQKHKNLQMLTGMRLNMVYEL